MKTGIYPMIKETVVRGSWKLDSKTQFFEGKLRFMHSFGSAEWTVK